ncbi:MAG: hypothetical protein Q9186_002896 [Xanthomendoza sp. 1 TL-2023]
MHAHSALLELLPKSSEYVSIFCGSLNALIKVLLAELRGPAKDTHTSDEDFYEKFEARITSIKRISAAIGREAQLGRSAETRDIHDAVQDLRIGLERQDRMFAIAEHERKELANQQWKEAQERDLQHRQKEKLLLAMWRSLGDSGHNLLSGQADGTLREARSGFARLEYSCQGIAPVRK